MKKMTFRKLFGGLCCAAMVAFAASCAQGADDESWSAGVTGVQLESPTIDDSCFEVVATSSGDVIKLTWPLVYGGGGYAVKVYDEAAPETLIIDENVDGQTVSFPLIEDANIAISIKTLGNARLNNTEAETATDYVFSTFGTLQKIPTGSEIAGWIKENYIAPEKALFGLVYELEENGQYTLDDTVDFNLDKVMFRGVGSETSRPVVTVNAGGNLMTQAGLKVLNINFDCINRTSKGILCFPNTPEPSLHNQTGSLGLSGISRGAYIIQKPIIIQDCYFKDLSNSLIYNNDTAWGIYDFRMLNCIVQFAYDGSNALMVQFSKGNYGHICWLTIENSTIFNTKETKGTYVQIPNNQNPDKVFGQMEKNRAKYLLQSNTFANSVPATSKNMTVNTPNTGTHLSHWFDNIFYNQNNPSKWLGNCQKETVNNTVYRTDKLNDEKYDADFTKGSTPQDPGFTADDFKSLDFSQPNAGVNFTPEGNALTDRRGDPRWL